MITVTTRRWKAGTASSWGLVVGCVILYLATPPQIYEKLSSSSKGNKEADHTRLITLPFRITKRELGGHVAPVTPSSSTADSTSPSTSLNNDIVPSPSPIGTKRILLKSEGRLEWDMLSQNRVLLNLYIKGSPGWLALGLSKKGSMIGPPSSSAVLGWWKNDLPHVSTIELDSKPPTKLPQKNDMIKLNASLQRNVGGFTHMSFVMNSGYPIGQSDIYNVPGPLGSQHNFIYAWGEEDHTTIQYHSVNRRGNVLNVDLGQIPEGKDALQVAQIPYFEMHGGILATIWSVTTLLGGVIARYFRYKPWWIDAHEFLQTIATVLSLPLTLLSWLGKGGTSDSAKHYSSFHGLFGIIFASAASVQGTLGSLSHSMFSHSFGCICYQHRILARMRKLHRALGKVLLMTATMQILLGLQHFQPVDIVTGTWGMLTIIFVTYASVVWGSVFVLEARHQYAFCFRKMKGDKLNNNYAKKFVFRVQTGSGYMTEKDLKKNDEIFLEVCTLIDTLLAEGSLFSDRNNIVFQWCQSKNGPGTGLLGKIFRTSKCSYPRGYRSMKTSEILKFASWIVANITTKEVDLDKRAIDIIDKIDKVLESDPGRRPGRYVSIFKNQEHQPPTSVVPISAANSHAESDT